MEIIVAIIGSGALSALVSGIVSLINANKKSKTGLDKAVQLLLLGEIERQTDRYIETGSLTREQFKRYQETYDAYKALNGNGYAEGMMSNVRSLHIRECENG